MHPVEPKCGLVMSCPRPCPINPLSLIGSASSLPLSTWLHFQGTNDVTELRKQPCFVSDVDSDVTAVSSKSQARGSVATTRAPLQGLSKIAIPLWHHLHVGLLQPNRTCTARTHARTRTHTHTHSNSRHPWWVVLKSDINSAMVQELS